MATFNMITQVFNLLDRVETASGRNAKIALIDDACKSESLKARLSLVVWYANNPFLTYRISSLETAHVNPIFSEVNDITLEQTWGQFTYYLDGLRLRTQELSAARSALFSVIGSLPHQDQKWFKRIVARDLKIGIATWDKWFPGLIPRVAPMLCSPWDGQTLKNTCIVEPKLDGLRAIGVVDGLDIKWYSRNGKELYNTARIDSEIRRLGLRDVVVDGEFDAGTFGESMSITKTQNEHPNASKLNFHLFDMLTVKEWYAKRSSDNTMARKERILNAFDGLASDSKIRVVPYKAATTPSEVYSIFDEHISKGYEGSIIKDIEAPYLCDDRSELWQKIKPTETADMTVYDIEEGTGRNEKRCGALKVRGVVTYKGKEYEIDTRVGTGFSDEDRQRFWNLAEQNALKGVVIEVRFQDVTVANLSAASSKTAADNYSLRFPVYLRTREDKQCN